MQRTNPTDCISIREYYDEGLGACSSCIAACQPFRTAGRYNDSICGEHCKEYYMKYVFKTTPNPTPWSITYNISVPESGTTNTSLNDDINTTVIAIPITIAVVILLAALLVTAMVYFRKQIAECFKVQGQQTQLKELELGEQAAAMMEDRDGHEVVIEGAIGGSLEVDLNNGEQYTSTHCGSPVRQPTDTLV